VRRLADILIGLSFLASGIYSGLLYYISLSKIVACMQNVFCSLYAEYYSINLNYLFWQSFTGLSVSLLFIATGTLLIVAIVLKKI
jgi:hypothetical protein